MADKTKVTGFTRRDFVKTVGIAGLAVAGAGVTGALAASENPPGADKANATPKRELGKTGVEVSILNLGGGIDTINNQLLLKQALKWGVTFWDTAARYMNGLSEEGYGRFFAGNPEARKEIFLATRLEPQGGNFTERLDQSLNRLQTDHVDLFYFHSIQAINEITPEMKSWAAAMKKEGKIKFLGFSTHTNMADCLLGASKLDWIDAVMMTYNFRVMNDPKMQEAISACTKSGIGLVAMKAMGGGHGKPATESPAELKIADRFLERGFTGKQAKLKVVWENPQIASICSRMPNLTILSANVAAARDQTKLSREDFEFLRQYALETKADYCAGCARICREAVAGAVPVNEVLRCLMYYRFYGEPELARLTFAGLPEEVRQRLTKVDYSQAERACPNGLAITELIRQAKELFGTLSNRLSSEMKRSVSWVGNILIILTVLAVAEVMAGLLSHMIARTTGIPFYLPHVTESYKDYQARLNPSLGWPSPDISRSRSNFYDASGARFIPAFPDPNRNPAYVSLYGDSFTEAVGVDHEHAWSNNLSKLLNCRVANYGVAGYGTDQAYLRYLANSGDQARVVVLAYVAENIQRNVNQFRNLLGPCPQCIIKPRFVLNAKGQLTLVPIPPLTEEEYVEVARNPEKFFDHDYFVPGGLAGYQKASFPYLWRILQTSNILLRRVGSNFQPYQELYRPGHPSQALEVTVAIIEAFCRSACARGQKPLVLIIPTVAEIFQYLRHQGWIYQPLLPRLAECNVEYLDMGPKISQYLGGADPKTIYDPKIQFHFNAAGNQLVAQTVFDFLTEIICRKNGQSPLKENQCFPRKSPTSMKSRAG